MVNHQDEEKLKHILNAINKIQKYTDDVDFDNFEDNEMLQDAVFKNLEIIGEAVYKITDETKDENDQIEWRKIEGLRHKLVHDYYKIDLNIVWQTRSKSLPKLERQIKQMLKED